MHAHDAHGLGFVWVFTLIPPHPFARVGRRGAVEAEALTAGAVMVGHLGGPVAASPGDQAA